MERREFLIRAGQTVIAVPLVLSAVSCGSEDSGPAAPNPSTEFDVTSSVDRGHTHRTTFTCADLSSGRLTYTSATGGGHTHTLQLQMGDAARILNGETVLVSNVPDGTGDNHTWSIQKPSNACT